MDSVLFSIVSDVNYLWRLIEKLNRYFSFL